MFITKLIVQCLCINIVLVMFDSYSLFFLDSSVFVRLRDSITEIVSFFWNNAPKDIG